MTKIILICWPLLVCALAFFYKNKQNGPKAMTGGPISTPKAFWLAYTVTTWFFLPLIFIFNHGVALPLKVMLAFHLLSWWARGPLELVMIYKWFNWSPRYGIAHDTFHLLGLLILYFFNSAGFHDLTAMNNIVAAFLFITIFATIAEISFAFLFLRARSEIEEKENIYFASDDPKWIFINRLTLVVVCAVMSHLVCQSIYAYLVL